MLLTDEELQTLESANTEDEWNDACDKVKKARGGQYPQDWFKRVIAGGVLERFGNRSGAYTGIRISAF